jgi:Fe-S-cluster containining protein
MENWCGTACCIAGWTNFLITDDENERKDEHDLFSAERKLGLTRNLAPCGHRFSGLGGLEEPSCPAWSQSRGIPRVFPRKAQIRRTMRCAE